MLIINIVDIKGIAILLLYIYILNIETSILFKKNKNIYKKLLKLLIPTIRKRSRHILNYFFYPAILFLRSCLYLYIIKLINLY